MFGIVGKRIIFKGGFKSNGFVEAPYSQTLSRRLRFNFSSATTLAMKMRALVLLLAATLALWTYYGTAVFYEMIVAGLAACL